MSRLELFSRSPSMMIVDLEGSFISFYKYIKAHTFPLTITVQMYFSSGNDRQNCQLQV